MAIPESQLETWSHQGSISQSSTTYNSIKGVLEANTTPYAGKSYKAFLQGSYGNDTNIWAESDVDIVICLNDCWQRDIESLSPEDKAAYQGAFVDATYGHVEFKNDVISVLTDQHGRHGDCNKQCHSERLEPGRNRNVDPWQRWQHIHDLGCSYNNRFECTRDRSQQGIRHHRHCCDGQRRHANAGAI